MTIQVLGSGCPTCRKLFELTKKAATELNLKTEVEYSADIRKITDMGLMSSPVLAIDGRPVLVGQLAPLDRIKELLTAGEAAPADKAGAGGCCG